MNDQQRPEVVSFFDPDTFTGTHVVIDPASKRCAIVDSVLDYDPKSGCTDEHSARRVIELVRERGLSVDWILETHVHADHLSAAPLLKAELGGQVGIGAHVVDVQAIFKELFNAEPAFATDGRQFDRLFGDGDSFEIGTLKARVMHTPGHTPACVTFVIGDAVFVGDTLFAPDFGTARCDFPGGDARTLYRSIQRVLSMPAGTRMFLCHDYPPATREFELETSVGAQRAHNKHVHEGVSEDEFVAMREARDATLDMPVLILQSVQVNMRGGDFPPPEDNGMRYLKMPVNAFKTSDPESAGSSEDAQRGAA
ncbi:MAG: MBL fold metallo-hydrolase [Pseudomonadales bacterium]|jgi:glyoxylase-like metal-dependent hydrolase (beta-lactamase superfamily II)|nr:MBL fold metallo-hydrolase [Pseudomonadales bacterium]